MSMDQIVDWYFLERIANESLPYIATQMGDIENPEMNLRREICRAITVVHGRLVELEEKNNDKP